MWRVKEEMGVVCYDRHEKGVYMIQPSSAQQELFCELAESCGSEEISINMSLFASTILYQEEVQHIFTISDYVLCQYIFCTMQYADSARW